MVDLCEVWEHEAKFVMDPEVPLKVVVESGINPLDIDEISTHEEVLSELNAQLAAISFMHSDFSRNDT